MTTNLPKTYDYPTGFEKIRRVFDFTQSTPLKILDIACGDGRLGAELVKLGHEVWGIDAHHEAVQTARKNGIDCLRGDITEGLPFPEKTFDVILLLDILEHLTNPEQLLTEAKNKLADNGSIIISLPNHFDIRNRLEILAGRGIVHWAHRKFPEHDAWNYQHIRFFRLQDMLALLKLTNLHPHTIQLNFMAGGIIPRRFTPAPLRTLLLKTFPHLFSGKFVLRVQTTANVMVSQPNHKPQFILLPTTPKVF